MARLRTMKDTDNCHPEGMIRINKYLADRGHCSRREADMWVERGWVWVNGKPASAGLRVGPDDHVDVRRIATQHQEDRVTMLLHKPLGYVSTQAEHGHQPASVLITAQTQWQEDRRRFLPNHTYHLACAGRLDADSTGLLVLTQDGRVVRSIIGENKQVEKEYLVRVACGAVTQDVRSLLDAHGLALLRHGLELDGKPLLPAKVEWINGEQLRFVLIEGKHRQIRRMCDLVGLKVTGLRRVRIGGVRLGHLPVGQWRYLLPDEKF